MKQFIILLLSMTVLTSCTEVISSQEAEVTPRVVINAMLIKDSVCVVKLSRTQNYYNSAPVPKITNGIITLTDGTTTETLAHIGNGVYRGAAITGQVNAVYSISVLIDGVTYSSTAQMPKVAPIDSLGYTFSSGSSIQEEGYYPIMYSVEPQNETNYYLFKYYRNDTLLNDSADFEISDDRFLGSTANGVQFPDAYLWKDTARVEMYSLTREAFTFYQDFFQQVNNDGGFFSSPPITPRSNFSNNAVGIFQVSDMSTDSIIIE